MKRDSIFTVGPFLEVRKRVLDFGHNLYYNHTLLNTLEAFEKLQVEYEMAVKESDIDKIQTKKKELEFYEAVITMATTAMASEDSLLLSGSLHD